MVAHLTLAKHTGSCHRLVSQIVIRNTQTIKNLFTSHNNVKLIIFINFFNPWNEMRPLQNIPFYEGIVDYPNPKNNRIMVKSHKFCFVNIVFNSLCTQRTTLAWNKTQDRNMFEKLGTEPGTGNSGRVLTAALLSSAARWQLLAGTHVVVAGPSIIFCGTTTRVGGTDSHQVEVEPSWQAGSACLSQQTHFWFYQNSKPWKNTLKMQSREMMREVPTGIG